MPVRTMGSAIFRHREFPRMQFWQLSNGRDFILVTYISPAEPDPQEVAEAQEIVDCLDLKDRPWWRPW